MNIERATEIARLLTYQEIHCAIDEEDLYRHTKDNDKRKIDQIIVMPSGDRGVFAYLDAVFRKNQTPQEFCSAAEITDFDVYIIFARRKEFDTLYWERASSHWDLDMVIAPHQ